MVKTGTFYPHVGVADPVPGSGMGNKSGSGSGIRDEHPISYFRQLRNNFLGVKILKFFDSDPDLGWINSNPGSATYFFTISSIPYICGICEHVCTYFYADPDAQTRPCIHIQN